jgi:hypothetical protein
MYTIFPLGEGGGGGGGSRRQVDEPFSLHEYFNLRAICLFHRVLTTTVKSTILLSTVIYNMYRDAIFFFYGYVNFATVKYFQAFSYVWKNKGFCR